MTKLAEFGARAKKASDDDRQTKAAQVRAILAGAGLLEFAEQARELFDAKLTFARIGDVVIGQEPESGYFDFMTKKDIDQMIGKTDSTTKSNSANIKHQSKKG